MYIFYIFYACILYLLHITIKLKENRLKIGKIVGMETKFSQYFY